MRVRKGRRLVPLALACLLSGCADNPAPKGWRSAPIDAQRTTRGGWIVVEPLASPGGKPNGDPTVEGELIAVDDSAIHVLTSSGFRSFPRAAPHRITVVAYATSTGALAGWAAAGAVSTLSHGAFLIFTAPMWAIAGTIAVHREKRAGMFQAGDLAPSFARFPQGLPAGIDVRALGPLVSSPSAVSPR